MHFATSNARGGKGNDEEGNTASPGATGAYCCCAEVSPEAVCNPFLGAGNEVVVGLADGGGADVCYVGASWVNCQ